MDGEEYQLNMPILLIIRGIIDQTHDELMAIVNMSLRIMEDSIDT